MQKDHYTLRCQKLLNSHLLSMTSGPHLSSPSSSPFSLTRVLILQGMQVQAAPARRTSPRAPALAVAAPAALRPALDALRSDAPQITWKLVTMWPLLSQTNPDPDPCGTSSTSSVNASCLQHIDEIISTAFASGHRRTKQKPVSVSGRTSRRGW